MLSNRSMPEDVLIPVLGYDNVPDAVDWLTRVFGFTERWRVGDHRAQVAVGPTSAVAITHRLDGLIPTGGDHVMVRVEDVDSHHLRSKEHGAEVIAPPSDFPYGERQYSVRDFSGRVWVFTQTIDNVAPEDWGGVSPG